jgi:hypothetical protein
MVEREGVAVAIRRQDVSEDGHYHAPGQRTGRADEWRRPAEHPSGQDERDVIKTLVLLVGESRVYRSHLENARSIVERLAADVDDVKVSLLLTSVRALLADRLGTPAHVDHLASATLRELED